MSTPTVQEFVEAKLEQALHDIDRSLVQSEIRGVVEEMNSRGVLWSSDTIARVFNA